MLSALLRLLGGAAGPWVVGAVAVLLAGSMATAGVQSLRLGHAKADLKTARAALVDPQTRRKWKDLAVERQTSLETCQGNRERLQGQLNAQNDAVGRWKAEAARRGADAEAAAREARSARAVAESRAQALASVTSASTCAGREAAIAEIVKGLTR